MSNTLNLGTDGNWATKEGSLLGYNSENNNYKPLPFDFSRASKATVVNKDGLIEEVGSGQPRIDYKDDTKGAMLLEPSRSNLITQSQAFDNSYWTKSGSSVVGGFASPSGDNNAFKLTSNNGGNIISRPSILSNTTHATSIYLKRVSGTGNVSIFKTNGSETIVTLTDEWQRFTDINSVNPSNAYMGVRLYGSNDEVLMFGAQLEAGSYSTSLINTQGGVVTRLAEKCEQNLSNVVSLTEGVVYIDTTNLGNDGTNANIISQNSVVDTVYCLRVGTNNRMACGLFASSVNIPINSTSAYPLGTRTKIAFHYKSGNSKLYINGSLEGTNGASFTLGSGFATALRLIDTASAYNAFPQKSIVREFKVYNSGLTEQELIALTQV